MATVSQPFSNQDEQGQGNTSGGANNNGNGNQQQQSGATQIAGAGGSAGTGGSTKPGLNANGGSSNNSAATTSGNFPNLQQYMGANANFNQAGGGLAGKVAGNLNQQGQQVQNNTAQATNVFNNQVNSANTNLNNAFTAAQADLTNPYQATQNNPGATGQFQQALSGNYSGPQNLNSLTGNNNYGNLQQQASNYTNQAQQTQTENGRFNLLSNMFGGNNYTQGQQTLDNSLMQGNPQQMQQLKGAVTQANSVNQNLNNAYNQSAQQGQAATANAQNIGQQTQAGLNNAISGQYANVNNEYGAAQNLQQQQMAAAQSGLTSGNISSDLAKELGISSLGGQSLYGTGAQDAAAVQANALNINNTATQADYNNFQALQKLTGNQTQDLTGNNSQYLNQFATNPNQLYNAGNLINGGNILGQVQQAQGAYTNAANPYASTVNSLGQNNSLYGQFGSQNGGGVNFGNQSANTALGINNPVTQNLNAILSGNNAIGTATGTQFGENMNNLQNITSAAGNSGDTTTGGGQQQAYFGALKSLLGLQNQYGTANTLNITPSTPQVGQAQLVNSYV
jgi:hypothetical protein